MSTIRVITIITPKDLMKLSPGMNLEAAERLLTARSDEISNLMGLAARQAMFDVLSQWRQGWYDRSPSPQIKG